jgi:hypothetical protein
MGAFMLCYGSPLSTKGMYRARHVPDLKSSRPQYARALIFCQVRGGDSNFIGLSFTTKASWRGGRLLL